MLDRRPKLLVDALGAIDAAMSFAIGKSLESYEADLLLRSGVERQLEILGEACARLVKEHDALFNEIPATRLAVGLRNRIIHGYDAVDDETVFRTVQDDLPGLRATLQLWLSQLERAG
ncbi:DUF86 domain-containing protein [Aquabacterium sp.]|uniref:HepT-like ribonuclease domain-containing protein n=1 Tax=Aquabacterium sp. TaxID=1872578 RepID=UPI002C5902AB|nr:HepT-like ribonuclease domain-containing protein [Aquabacterium sp.]HSW07184.1 HepT-like ribonuclease domain-containing protein [Aquabacterium sp.]